MTVVNSRTVKIAAAPTASAYDDPEHEDENSEDEQYGSVPTWGKTEERQGADHCPREHD